MVCIVLWPFCGSHCSVALLWFALFCGPSVVRTVLWPFCGSHCSVALLWFALFCDRSRETGISQTLV